VTDLLDPVVLLHGQPGSARDWQPVLDELPDRLPALAIDRPGWDGSRSAGDLRQNAQAALDALTRAGIERATVVGHSFGGSVATWLASHHPERVGALVLVAPAANRASLYPLDRWLALPVAGFLTSASLMASAGLTLASGQARRLIAGQLQLDERFLRDAGRALRTPSAWTAFATEQRALIRELPELERSLGAIEAPTTVVIGSRDRIVPRESARQLATQIRGAELVELEGVSHLIPLQAPARLAELILLAADRPGTVAH
jgi:pimeloyl-ACP methyl ester carboxylesterase